MRIGKLAEKAGVSRDTIRLYERMGLIKKVTRPYEYNNYKEYDEENVERIKLILVMKQFGMTLRECGEVLDNIESDKFDMDYQSAFVTQKLKEIDEKIKELKSLKKILKKYVDVYCSRLDDQRQ